MTSFSSLSLASAQLQALDTLGYHSMTPVQAQALPLILDGRDVIAQARTGSGKTAAFGIGILQAINPRFFGVQALVLCPTRELADQVGGEIRRLARGVPNIKLVLLCGGKPMGPQIGSLEHGAHIIVGTPGRIGDHLRKNTLRLDGLNILVLDEADRMLDMGFAEAVDAIIGHTPADRQTLLFSATFPDAIRRMSQSIQHQPAAVTVAGEHAADVIEQHFYEVNREQRDEGLLALFVHYRPENALVFCQTRLQCDEVAALLRATDIQALAIHGDLEQRERDQVLVQFANASCAVLVATDVAARGLDISALALVINYELPRSPDVYLHRIGRTGRAGESGRAASLVTPSDAPRLRAIEEHQGAAISCRSLPRAKGVAKYSLQAPMITLQLDAGRKQKLRPGDILGALTGDAGLAADGIGKIEIHDRSSFVAVKREDVREAMAYLGRGKVKGRSIRARLIGTGPERT
ncbi:MAG: ATP-dependent RNA helicase DbpA [Chromatocurvus sp.]